MKKNGFLFTLLVAGVVFASSSCNNNTQDDKIIVGLECNYSPFNWTTQQESEFTFPIEGLDGYYADGYDVQIAKYIGEQLGVEVVIKKYQWEALIPAMQSKEINTIIAGMSYTQERDLTIDFTNAYYTSEMVGVVRADSDLTTVDSIQDLSGSNVVSQLGTVQDTIIDQINGVIHHPGVETFNIGALAVMSDDSDCLIAELPVATAICAANPELQVVRFTQENFTGLDEDSLSVAIGIYEGNTTFANSINNALATLSNDDRQAMMSATIARASEQGI